MTKDGPILLTTWSTASCQPRSEPETHHHLGKTSSFSPASHPKQTDNNQNNQPETSRSACTFVSAPSQAPALGARDSDTLHLPAALRRVVPAIPPATFLYDGGLYDRAFMGGFVLHR